MAPALSNRLQEYVTSSTLAGGGELEILVPINFPSREFSLLTQAVDGERGTGEEAEEEEEKGEREGERKGEGGEGGGLRRKRKNTGDCYFRRRSRSNDYPIRFHWLTSFEV